MAHSYCRCLMHCVFSTKGRMNLLIPELQPRLWGYLAGIAKRHKMQALMVGGIENHVHVLVNLPATLSVAEALQALKGNSSKWLNEECPPVRPFAWQEGYGAFSIGASQVAASVRYIRTQREHHRRRGFEQEFVAILKRHGIAYDPRYVFDTQIVG